MANECFKSGRHPTVSDINAILGTNILPSELETIITGPHLFFDKMTSTKIVLNIIRKTNDMSKKNISGIYI